MANMQLPEGFGTASYTGGEREFKFFKMEEGVNVYRILPPMKSLRNNRRGWGIYYGLHYGWNGQDQNDPAKTRFRPFLCIQERDFKTQMVTCTCEACSLRDQRMEQYETLKKRCDAERTPDSERKALLSPLADWLKTHTIDRGWRMLVMNQKNEFGVLRISHTTKKKLDALVQKLSGQGYDPFGVKGLWLEFTRSGQGFQTEVDVGVHSIMETINGRKVQTYAESELTYDLATRALEVCPDLNEMMENCRLSAEQISKMVKGSGDPAEVDAVWAWAQKAKKEPEAAEASPDPMPAWAEAPKPAPKAAPVVQEEDEEAAMMRKLAELRAKKAALVAGVPTSPDPAAKPAPKAAPASADDLLNMSDDDFEAAFKGRG